MITDKFKKYIDSQTEITKEQKSVNELDFLILELGDGLNLKFVRVINRNTDKCNYIVSSRTLVKDLPIYEEEFYYVWNRLQEIHLLKCIGLFR